jgi:hypothetical protein
MSYKNVMVIKAAVCLVFGILLISVPGIVFGILGAELSPGGTFAAREYAAALIGTMLLTWFARNVGESEARHAIILALFAYDAVAFVASLIAVLSRALNPLGWFIVAIYLFFTLTFGNLLLPKKTAS